MVCAIHVGLKLGLPNGRRKNYRRFQWTKFFSNDRFAMAFRLKPDHLPNIIQIDHKIICRMIIQITI